MSKNLLKVAGPIIMKALYDVGTSTLKRKAGDMLMKTANKRYRVSKVKKSRPYKKGGARKRGTKARIKSLEKRIKEGEVEWIDKTYQTSYVAWSPRRVQYNDQFGIAQATYTQLMGRLEVYNAATGNWVVRDPSLGTETKSIFIDSIFNELTIKNNNGVGAEVTVYVCMPVVDTGNAPLTDWDVVVPQEVADGIPDNRSTLLYPSESIGFQRRWKIIKTHKKRLSCGQIFKVNHTAKNINYDPEFGAYAYTKMQKAFRFFVRCTGTMVHLEETSVVTSVGTNDGGLDLHFKQIIKCRYDGGMTARRIHTNNASGNNVGMYEYVPTNKLQVNDP